MKINDITHIKDVCRYKKKSWIDDFYTVYESEIVSNKTCFFLHEKILALFPHAEKRLITLFRLFWIFVLLMLETIAYRYPIPLVKKHMF